MDRTAEEFIGVSKKYRYTKRGIEVAAGMALLCLIGYFAMDARSQAWIADLRKEIATTNSQLLDDPVQGLVSAIKFTEKTQTNHYFLQSKDIAMIATDDVQPTLQNAINNVQEYARLDGHQGTINDVDLSEDGKTIVSADVDRVLKVWDWDTKTGHLRPAWAGYPKSSDRHTDAIIDVVLSHDPKGKWLLSASLDKTVKIWNTQLGQLLDTLKHDGSLTDVLISQDGKTIVSASKVEKDGSTIQDGTVKVWDWNGRKAHLLYEKKQASNSITDIAISEDGTTIASGDQDGKVNVWAVRSGKRLQSLSWDNSRVTSIAIAADGKTIIWGNQNNQVVVWDTLHTKPRELGKHQGTVSDVKLSRDGKMIASAGDDAVIHLWDLPLEKLKYTLLGHQASLNKMLFSKDSKYLFSTGKDKTIRIWDTSTGHLLDILVGHTNAIEAISYDLARKTLVSAGGDRTVRIWHPDFQIPQYLQYERASKIPVPSSVYAVATARNSSIVAVGGSDDSVWLWDRSSNKSIQLPKKHIGSIYTLAFSPDGQTLVSGGGGKKIAIWDVPNKSFKRYLNNAPINTINALAFAPKDNNLVVSGGRDKQILLWHLDTGKSFPFNQQSEGSIQAIAFNSDSTILASGDRKGNIYLWDFQSQSLINTLKNTDAQSNTHDNSITALAFHPTQNNLLVSANTNGTMFLWNTKTGKVTQEITNIESNKPIGSIQTIAFSPNQQYLASAGNDTTIRLWKKNETSGFYEFDHLIGKHQASVYSVAFTADGKNLISGGDDANVNFWSVEKQNPKLKPACDRLKAHPALKDIKKTCDQILLPKK